MHRVAIAAAVLSIALVGCPRHGSDSTDTGAAPAASSAAPTASQVTLAPLTETASAAPTASSESVPPLVTGSHPTATAKPAGSPATTAAASASAKPVTASSQAQLRQCCAALRKQAQHDAAQAAQLNQAAVVCDGLVAAMAGAPTMPALDPVKQMLGGAQLPPVCSGL